MATVKKRVFCSVSFISVHTIHKWRPVPIQCFIFRNEMCMLFSLMYKCVRVSVCVYFCKPGTLLKTSYVHNVCNTESRVDNRKHTMHEYTLQNRTSDISKRGKKREKGRIAVASLKTKKNKEKLKCEYSSWGAENKY